jgi:hypothetical protein
MTTHTQTTTADSNGRSGGDVYVFNQDAITELAWELEASQGNFTLILAHCNYETLREVIVQKLYDISPVNICELTLKRSAQTLLGEIQSVLPKDSPEALMIFGLETVKDLDSLLTATNQIREEFRKHFPFPLVLWVNDEVLKSVIRLAPDFHNWGGTPVEFVTVENRLFGALEHHKEHLFNAVLEAGTGQFIPNSALFGPGYQQELAAALEDLQQRGQTLTPEQAATLELFLGREAYVEDALEKALAHYQASLDAWQQMGQLIRQGILLYHIGLCYLRQAERYGANRCLCWEEAQHYFQTMLERFEQAQRPDLLARFIHQLGKTLQYLEAWEDLSELAERSLALQQAHSNFLQLAQAYGFLADVALHQSHWVEAKQTAQMALEVIAQLPAHQHWHRSPYLLLLAQAQQALGEFEQAIAHLETAQALGPQDAPQRYSQILACLGALYFQQKRYLKAFQVKQERRSIEKQYGLCPFIGAGRLKAKRHDGWSLAATEATTMAQEIAVSSRRQDVDHLFQRLAESRYKLTVLYGPSGVGKSSLIEAGLMPYLQDKEVIGTRDVVPVLLRAYPHWEQTLGQNLITALQSTPLEGDLPAACNGASDILNLLRQSEAHNLLPVIIFDQFEEFFFVCKDSDQQQHFFECFRDCLKIPTVKVILSLREDYLHHLLLQGKRHKVVLDSIDDNILDKKNLYYIGNFSPADTRAIIQVLTEHSRFFLEDNLIDAVVADLTDEFGEVRPIELQVVGEQLQAENITALVQYQERGPKAHLVLRYLETVLKDCGLENRQLAELVLYLLTEENTTRPLRTRTELETDLSTLPKALAISRDQLDLVLQVLVRSGLVFELPETPTNRYQLVHDYLIGFIRRQEPKLKELAAELEQERKKLQHSEQQLNTVLRQRLRRSIATGMGLGTLAVLAFGFALQTEYQRKEIAIREVEQ